MRRKPKQSVRKQANKGRKDQRRGNHSKIKEEDTPSHASEIREICLYRKTENCFYRKPGTSHYRTFYRKFGKRTAEGEIGRNYS